MRRDNRQPDSLPMPPVKSTKLSDTSGNPSESYDWRQLAVVRQEWQQAFRYPYVNRFELTLAELRTLNRELEGALP